MNKNLSISNPLSLSLSPTNSSRPLRFAIGLPPTLENKENTHPYGSAAAAHASAAAAAAAASNDSSNDSDQSDGPILYRDDASSGGGGSVPEPRQAKIARKESLSLKLAMRPNVDELISRNILHIQSENERQESKEAIGARLIRRLSMRPTPEELIERNILKSSECGWPWRAPIEHTSVGDIC